MLIQKERKNVFCIETNYLNFEYDWKLLREETNPFENDKYTHIYI